MAIDRRPEPPLEPPTDTPQTTGPAASSTAGAAIGRRASLRAAIRVLLFATFGGVLVAFGIDRWARHQAQTAFDTVDKALESQREPGKPTAADVHKLIGREPDQPAEPPWNTETYNWRGAAHSFTLFVAYDGNGVLKDVSIDAKPPVNRGPDASESPGSDDPE